MESGRVAGEDLGVLQDDSHIHKAEGTDSRLRRTCDSACGEPNHSRLLQSATQKHRTAIPVRLGVGVVGQVPAAACGSRPCAGGRGRCADCEKRVNFACL